MQVPPDILVWIGGALFAQFTLVIHLLVAILGRVSAIETKQAIQNQRINYIEEKKVSYS